MRERRQREQGKQRELRGEDCAAVVVTEKPEEEDEDKHREDEHRRVGKKQKEIDHGNEV